MLQPRLPASWRECELRWRLPGSAEVCLVTLTNRPGGAGKVFGASLE
jgi:hypothetical protein